MPFILTYNKKVRQALEAPANLSIDVLVILGLAGLLVAIGSIFGHAAAPRPHGVQIDLSFSALPKYAFFSVSRAVLAYLISLVFTLVYGTITAHSRLAEKFMIPLLDVLQSLPVLSFLPGLVLIFIRLFPTSWLGLELACVVMIFTAQAWNMTFSYHTSVRAIPEALREAAAIQRLTVWQRFRYLELPASMIGLVWNSMMSMAGGWFVITVEEAFTLNGVDYRLPGLGSYMNQAQVAWDKPAMIAGVIAMITVIVMLDQLVWRPIVVWSERFKLEDISSTEVSHSWFLQFLRRSHFLKWVGSLTHRRSDEHMPAMHLQTEPAPQKSPLRKKILRDVVSWVIVIILIALAGWGAFQLARLLTALPIHDTPETNGWLAVLWGLVLSFARVLAAVFLGALWTLPAGVLIGLSPKWANRLQPIVQIVAAFPAPMIYIMVIFLLVTKLHIHFTFASAVLMLLGTQWYTLFNVIAGAMAIPSDLREAATIYHLGSWKRWTEVYIPAVFPFLVTGLITAAGGAWNATIVAELVSIPGSADHAAFGLGYLIDIATPKGQYPLLAASVVTMGLTVVIVNRIFWKRIYRLAESRYSLNV
jgi:NitT/TauT family transport system permease protein